MRSCQTIHDRAGPSKSIKRDDLRELIESTYRIVYLILPDRIDIVTVRDTRRVLSRRPDDLSRSAGG